MINPLTKKNIYLTTLSLLLSLLLSGCVQSPVFKSDDYAFIESNYPIIAINGADIEKTYQLDIKAGENSLLVVYNTYEYDYLCTFSWLAKAGTAYEITDQENQYPLTLYRWYKKNGLWAIRLAPVDPLECKQKPVQ